MDLSLYKDESQIEKKSKRMSNDGEGSSKKSESSGSKKRKTVDEDDDFLETPRKKKKSSKSNAKRKSETKATSAKVISYNCLFVNVTQTAWKEDVYISSFFVYFLFILLYFNRFKKSPKRKLADKGDATDSDDGSPLAKRSPAKQKSTDDEAAGSEANGNSAYIRQPHSKRVLWKYITK